MPNKATHTSVGILAGGGTTAYRAREQEEAHILEIIGGCIGGYIGSCLPDVIEPASWPGHRHLAHSAIVGGGIVYGLYNMLERWDTFFRSKAEHYKDINKDYLHWLQKLLYSILEVLSRIIAGGLSGLGTGYLSHLLLDSSTPNGLPLI